MAMTMRNTTITREMQTYQTNPKTQKGSSVRDILTAVVLSGMFVCDIPNIFCIFGVVLYLVFRLLQYQRSPRTVHHTPPKSLFKSVGNRSLKNRHTKDPKLNDDEDISVTSLAFSSLAAVTEIMTSKSKDRSDTLEFEQGDEALATMRAKLQVEIKKKQSLTARLLEEEKLRKELDEIKQTQQQVNDPQVDQTVDHDHFNYKALLVAEQEKVKALEEIIQLQEQEREKKLEETADNTPEQRLANMQHTRMRLIKCQKLLTNEREYSCTLKEQIDEMNTLVNTKTQEMIALNINSENWESLCFSTERKVKDLENELDKKKKILEEEQNRINDFESQKTEMLSLLESEQANVRKLHEQHQKQIGLLSKTREKNESFEKLVAEKESDLSIIQDSLLAKTEETHTLIEKIKQMELANSDEKARKESMEKALQEKDGQFRAASDAVSDLAKQLQERETLFRDSTETVLDLERQKVNLIKDIENERQKACEIDEERIFLLEAERANTEEVRTLVEDIDARLSAERERYNKLERDTQATHEHQRTKIVALEQEEAALSGLVASERRKVHSLESQLQKQDETLQESIQAMHQAKARMQATLEAERHKVKGLKSENSKLSQLLQNEQGTISSIRQENEGLDDRLSETQNKFVELASTLEETTSALEESDRLLSAEQEKNDDLTRKLCDLQIEIESSKNSLANTIASETDLQNTREELLQLKISFEVLQQEYSQMETTLLENKKNLSQRLQSEQTKLQLLQAKAKDLRSAHKETMKELECQKKTLESELSAEQNKNSLLEDEMSDLKIKLGTTEETLLELKQLLTSEKESNETLNDAIHEIQGELEAKERHFNDLEDEHKKISDLHNQMKDTEKNWKDQLEIEKQKTEQLEMLQEEMNRALSDEREKVKGLEAVKDINVEDLQKSLGTEMEANEALNDAITKVQDELEEKTQELNVLHNENKQLSDLLNQERKRSKAQEFHSEKAEIMLSGEKEKLLELQKQMEGVENKWKDQLGGEKLKNKRLEILQDTTNQALHDEREKVERLEEEKKVDTTSIEAMIQQLEELQEYLTEGKAKISALEANEKLLIVKEQKLSKLQFQLEEVQGNLASEKIRVEDLKASYNDFKKESTLKLSQAKSLMNADSRKIHELQRAKVDAQFELRAVKERLEAMEKEQGQNIILLESSKNRIKELDLHSEHLDASLKKEKQAIRVLKAHMSDLETNLNKAGGREQEVKVFYEAENLETFEAMKREIVSLVSRIKQRDLLLSTMLTDIGRNSSFGGKAVADKVQNFVAEFERRTSIKLAESDDRIRNQALTISSSFRRLGYQLCWTLPLVPLVAYGQTDTSTLLKETMYAMFGFSG